MAVKKLSPDNWQQRNMVKPIHSPPIQVLVPIIEYSLPKSAGQINAAGLHGLLGGADQDLWEVMLREAVQNSWDARQTSNGPIKFRVRGYTADINCFDFLQKTLVGREGRRLVSEIGENLIFLELSDRNTIGLDGSTGYSKQSIPSNFLRFVFETGRNPGQRTEGGTYGYGKSSFFALSRLGTVAFHSRIKETTSNRYEDRFMIIRADRFRDPGRCWWGKKIVKNGGTWVEPLIDGDARAAAAALGMTPFSKKETGTSILIIDPILEEEETEDFTKNVPWILEEKLRKLAAAMTKWFWPKFCYAKEIQFDIKLDQKRIPIPDPITTFPYNHYSKAYRAITDPAIETIQKTTITSQRPKAVLGTMAVVHTGRDGIRSVAYIRDVGFVVFYKEQETSGETGLEEAYGVFKTVDNNEMIIIGGQEKSVLDAFRKSENQSHDEWNPHNCQESWQKTIIRVALRNSWNVLIGEKRKDEQNTSAYRLSWLKQDLGAFIYEGVLSKRKLKEVQKGSDKDIVTSSLRRIQSIEKTLHSDGNGVVVGIPLEYIQEEKSLGSQLFQILPAVRTENGGIETNSLEGIVESVGIAEYDTKKYIHTEIERNKSVAGSKIIVRLTKNGRYIAFFKVLRPVMMDLIIITLNE